MKKSDHIHRFVEEIWKWYAVHKRDLPWRDLQIEDDTERAYQVLVSEIMLQQTQVPRVIIIFKRFLEKFPTLKSLASASNKDVILAWQGMGYNSRAIRLRDAAKTIITQYNGIFPTEMKDLLSIKGIGHYTAAAVRNFAFNIATPCIDTNIRRILHRTFFGPEYSDGTWEKGDADLLKIAGEVLEVAIEKVPSCDLLVASLNKREVSQLMKTSNKQLVTSNLQEEDSQTVDGIPKKTAAAWHAALMDFGSLIQTKKNPKWDTCPLTQKGLCKAAYKKLIPKQSNKELKKEPGRFVGSTYIPNRIFRGRVIEVLREEDAGLQLDTIGERISIDWVKKEQKEWLFFLLKKLEKDHLITKKGTIYTLAD